MSDLRLARPIWRGRDWLDALTIACIEHAEQIVRDERPDLAHPFSVSQGSYRGDNGDPDSGTTHRLGGAVDMSWCGHEFCLLALRRAGMFIWHRTPSQGNWPHHFHGAPIGHPLMDFRLAAQEQSYFARGNGLGGADDGPRLNPIPDPVWPWPEEDDMPAPKDWDAADWQAFRQHLLPSIALAVWEFVVRPKTSTQTEQTAEAALKKAANR